jgi:hypothetical protein
MSRIFVHIDRLVVGGPVDRRTIETAVREAIARELSRPGAAESLVVRGDRGTVDAGRVSAHAGPVALGAAIGRSLGGGSGK